MQDFGSGDTSSNLVGGIKTKSWNRIITLLGSLGQPSFMSTPTATQSDVFSTIKPEYSNHTITAGLASGLLTQEDAALIS